MSLESELKRYLLSQTTLQALVGDRVFDRQVPPGKEYPAVVYQRISTPRVDTLDGPTGLAWPRIQISAYARNETDRDAIAKRLRLILNGYDGVWGEYTIRNIRLLDERVIASPNHTNSVNQFEVTQLDFQIEHSEPLS